MQAARSSRYSTLAPTAHAGALAACRELTDAIHPGLDLGREIRSVASQRSATRCCCGRRALAGFAVCHRGAGSEAGSGACYVKFGAVRAGPAAATTFTRLVAVRARSPQRRTSRCSWPASTSPTMTPTGMLGYGFRTVTQGVAMHRPNVPGYHRPDLYALDDWR